MTSGRRKDLFWRSAMSGGRATVMRRSGDSNVTQSGDISSVDPLGHWLLDQFYIECKHYKNIQLDHYLLNRKGKIAKWIKECQKHAEGKSWVLIVKQNSIPALVFTDAPYVKGRDSAQLYNFQTLLIVGTFGFSTPIMLLKLDQLLAAIRSAHPATEVVRRRPRAA